MSTDDDVDWTGCALAQDCVDVIQRHVVNYSVVDLHDLIPTPKGTEGKFRKRCWKERRKKNTEKRNTSVFESMHSVDLRSKDPLK